MDFHLDRRLRLKTSDEIEHNGLYPRAIIEIEEGGKQVGRDFIPWHWNLTFHGTEITMRDHLGFVQGTAPRQTGGSTIIVSLRPLRTRGGMLWGKEPNYQIFGTDRYLRDFQLRIEPARDGTSPGCTAWASASYSSEVDFRTETQSDCLQFTMTLEQGAFDRYVWNLAQGLVDEVALSVGSVDGFYSDWSPGITTDLIKILAGQEHVVEGADDVDLPRIGHVGEVDLAFVTRRQLRQPEDEYMSAQEASEREEREEAPEGVRKSRTLWPRIR